MFFLEIFRNKKCSKKWLRAVNRQGPTWRGRHGGASGSSAWGAESKMQIAILTMQMGDYCFLHQTGQTRQPSKDNTKKTWHFCFPQRKQNALGERTEQSARFLSFVWLDLGFSSALERFLLCRTLGLCEHSGVRGAVSAKENTRVRAC